MAQERARGREEKLERRAVMLDAAQRVLARKPFQELKIAEVAQEARLAKSTVFLYFQTREALFLEVLAGLLREFFADLEARLEDGRGRWTPHRAAREIAALAEEHAPMTRLLTVLHSSLERNANRDSLLVFKQLLLASMTQAGRVLEEKLTFLPAGGGVRLLLRLHALVIGLRQMAEPPPLLGELLRRPELAQLNVDFREELTRTLGALLTGMSGPNGA